MPSMGDSISEGTIVEWAKQPGDSVELDEVVVVLETDKVRGKVFGRGPCLRPLWSKEKRWPYIGHPALFRGLESLNVRSMPSDFTCLEQGNRPYMYKRR